jgi:hypothetical protein
MIWWIAAVAALGTASAVCLRIGAWHSREAAYWYDVAARVRFRPELDLIYRPILEHAQAHRPGVLRRALGWRPPPERMGRR